VLQRIGVPRQSVAATNREEAPGGETGASLCSFLDRLLGMGWGKPVHLANQLLAARIVPRAEPASELLSLMGADNR
jgi:hypothetical protein